MKYWINNKSAVAFNIDGIIVKKESLLLQKVSFYTKVLVVVQSILKFLKSQTLIHH